MRKIALITGASEGIGRALAIELCRAGHNIWAVARNAERLDDLLVELNTISGAQPGPEARHRAIPADLTDPTARQQVLGLLAPPHPAPDGQETDREPERPSILINNAGFGQFGEFGSSNLEKQRAMVRLNVEALTELSHGFLARAKSGDALVNVASVLGFMPLPSQPLYAATKAFVLSLTESLWAQYEAKGVYVTCLCPGSTSTAFLAKSEIGERRHPPSLIVNDALLWPRLAAKR